jgi:glycosyltransferase involved in cell wall biosynthesis
MPMLDDAVTPKRILIIGMFDSIHFVRWLQQFEDSTFQFVLMPSKKFRHIHPGLATLIAKGTNFSIFRPLSLFPHRFLGFVDLLLTYVDNFLHIHIRSYLLKRLLSKDIFQFVHLVEIQGAGYRLLEARVKLPTETKIIVTNWGSDIYFFQNNMTDREKIRQVLNMADFYSAECYRDYELAHQLGFHGTSLPCIPNAGGFDYIPNLSAEGLNLDGRNTIVCKGYGGQFGLGAHLIEVARAILLQSAQWNFHFYSVTDDLLDRIHQLKMEFPRNIHFSTQRRKLSPGEMRQLFMSSRVYIGASRSDGLSTSFLEALCFGAFPIQTNTSCADEMLKKGFHAAIVPPEREAILKAFENISKNEEELKRFVLQNNLLAQTHLNYESIRSIARTFYA